ncbi:MAG: YbaK/EbsC family protein [Acidobacteria bacterium]|nr:YbaK/EbsC family protein [Acidobacteriota bacterium]
MAIPQSIEHFLGDQHVSYSVLHHPPVYTAQEEAAATHVPGMQWAKTVACIADDRPILAVLPASSMIDLDRLRAAAGARVVRLASEREFEAFYPECETGAMPPLGPLYGQPVFVDRSLAGSNEIVFHAGSHTDAIRVSYDDFTRVVQPRVADFARTAGRGEAQ